MRIPIKDIIFVFLQFALFVAFAFEVGAMRIYFPDVLFWIGVGMLILGALTTLIAVLQLNVHLSPFPSPLPGSRLIMKGVYKHIRHPIYTGILMAFFGFAIIADSGYKLIITLLLFVLFNLKTLYEEKQLMEMFPDYSKYKQRSGRFFPKLW
ncbi:isoprenylcysteine carboxylmethyltransferase family protein [Aequorivita sp. H23M31]|uniref:Isoprenylcysteine carboxylmethyltransferase family protein n=1 Tax=Aequorivita ciconiae TaxID=2494375 RepID=A0A410G1G0_9FLAO|nr:isoprenylcysteine carboxylmethyltransferase family protein [Aequorivita sp. H23M31]